MSIRREDYCCEPLELVENYQQAKADNFAGWCIHHRLEIQQDGTRVSRQELIDKGLYYDRPASELVFMKVCEHRRLHLIGNTLNKGRTPSADTRLKMSAAKKGEKCYIFGMHHSAETRLKMSAARKGKNHSAETCKKIAEANKSKHRSDETRQKMSKSWKGKHWWNDGVSCKRSRECPGEVWTRGRLSTKFK